MNVISDTAPWIGIGTVLGLLAYGLFPPLPDAEGGPYQYLYSPLYYMLTGLGLGLAIEVGLAIRKRLRRPTSSY